MNYRNPRKVKMPQFTAVLLFLLTFSLTVFLITGCEDDDNNCIDCPDHTPVVVVPDHYPSIQAAIEAVPADGGTVYIRAGTHILTQGIHIDRSNLSLIGEKGTLLKLDSAVNQPVILVGSDVYPPTDTVANITVTNLEIDGNNGQQTSEQDPNRTEIYNNGISIRMAVGIDVRNIDVHHCRSGGIVVDQQSGKVVLENITAHHNSYDGLALYESRDIMVANFLLYENTYSGLSIDWDLRLSIFNDGIIRDNGDNGIFILYSRDLAFHDLTIANNTNHGCFYSHNDAVVEGGVRRALFEGCAFLDNGGYGIMASSPLTQSPGNCTIGCLFSGNDSGFIGGIGVVIEEGNIYH